MEFQLNEALPCTCDLRVNQLFINLGLMKNAKQFFFCQSYLWNIYLLVRGRNGYFEYWKFKGKFYMK